MDDAYTIHKTNQKIVWVLLETIGKELIILTARIHQNGWIPGSMK
jgi:hypothetical protein